MSFCSDINDSLTSLKAGHPHMMLETEGVSGNNSSFCVKPDYDVFTRMTELDEGYRQINKHLIDLSYE